MARCLEGLLGGSCERNAPSQDSVDVPRTGMQPRAWLGILLCDEMPFLIWQDTSSNSLLNRASLEVGEF